MSNATSVDFARSWRVFLIHLTLLENSEINPMPGLLFPGNAPQEYFQSFIASSFYIRMVSLLDDALREYIDTASLPRPEKYRECLYWRIKVLGKNERLLDANQLHRIRERRNEIAHEAEAKTDWQEVSSDLRVVHAELENLGLVGRMPRYEVFGERTPIASEDPGVFFTDCLTCGVKEGDVIVLKVSWSADIRNN